MRAGRYAAVDIGTVTCRLLIADVDETGQLSEVARDMEICNLGLDVDCTQLLQPESIGRTVSALERFSDTVMGLRETEPARPFAGIRAVATSASRDAKNAADFQAAVSERTIFHLEVIPGSEEAALSFAGASSAFPGEDVVVVDVGGGSTEVVAGRSGSEPRIARSFDVGCRRVTERFLRHDPPQPDELAQAREWIASVFGDYFVQLEDEGLLPALIVAVAGTATSAVTMRDRIEAYDPALVHGVRVSVSDLRDLVRMLAALPLEQRKKVVGLEPKRAPVIVAGMLILQVVLELAGADSFVASERDILHGLIAFEANLA